jgi:hypothetical protein
VIRVRFYNPANSVTYAETAASSFTISQKLNAIPDWKITVLRTAIPLIQLIGNPIAADIFINGKLITGGMCQFVPDKGTSSVDINGRQWIDLLYDRRAWSQAVYKDTYILVVMGELLRRAGWRLGDISTMIDKDGKLTIDLRQAAQLLNQITTALQGVTGLFYRYGGVIGGQHSLDLGTFNENTALKLIQPGSNEQPAVESNTGWITSFQQDVDQTDIYQKAEGFGGDVMISAAVTRAINLGDALTADPTLATNPDFPIFTEIASYVYYVINNSVVTATAATFQRQTQFAPETSGSPATAADIKNAGLALYNWLVAFLKDHQKNTNTLKIGAFGGGDLFIPVGGSVYVRYTQQVDLWNPLLEQPESDTILIEGYYRCTDYSVKVDNNDMLSVDYSLTDGDVLTNSDLYVSLYDKVQQAPPPAGVVYVPTFPPQLNTVTSSVSAGLPDTTMSDGSPGKLVSFTLPGAPVGATGIYMAGLPYATTYVPSVKPVIELVTDTVFGVGTVTARISINGGWDTYYSANLTMKVIWI